MSTRIFTSPSAAIAQRFRTPTYVGSSSFINFLRHMSSQATSASSSSSTSSSSQPTILPTSSDLAKIAQNLSARVKSNAENNGNNSTKPHPFSMRFANTNKPFFPISSKNLRDAAPRKKKYGRSSGKVQRRPKVFSRSKFQDGRMQPIWERTAKWPEAIMQRRNVKLEQLNLAKLRYFIEKGRIDARFPITQKHLLDSKCVTKIKRGVKLFNVNDYPFPYKIDIEVCSADQGSIDAIKRVGGSVTIVYYDRVGLRAHLKPEKFDILPRNARPSLERVAFLEKMRARGCAVKYIKPLWLIREEQRVKAEVTNYVCKFDLG